MVDKVEIADDEAVSIGSDHFIFPQKFEGKPTISDKGDSKVSVD